MQCACNVRNNNHKQYWYRVFEAIISHISKLYAYCTYTYILHKEIKGIGSLAFIFTLQIISWHSRPILCLWHFRLNNNCIISKFYENSITMQQNRDDFQYNMNLWIWSYLLLSICQRLWISLKYFLFASGIFSIFFFICTIDDMYRQWYRLYIHIDWRHRFYNNKIQTFCINNLNFSFLRIC